MANLNETQVIIKSNDRVTGSDTWESTIGNLESWELTDNQINEILNGETVECISPNGRRIIWITKK